MEIRLREISRFFVAPRREFAPTVSARQRTPFSINTSTSVCIFFLRLCKYFGKQFEICAQKSRGQPAGAKTHGERDKNKSILSFLF